MSSVLNASVVINYYLESNIFKQKVGYMKKTLTIAREKVLLLRTLLLCTLFNEGSREGRQGRRKKENDNEKKA